MPTRALPEFLDDGALKYPGIVSREHPDGKTYTVPPPDADTGLRWASLGDLVMFQNPTAEQLGRLKLDDDEEMSLYEQIFGCTKDCRAPIDDAGARGPECGSTLDEMRADGVPWPRIRQIAQDAFMFWAVNEQFADAVLAAPGEAEARGNRATRRAAKKATSTATTPRPKAGSSSAKASTATQGRTRSRTSTPSSRPTRKPAERKKAG